MDLTRSTPAVAAKPAQSVLPQKEVRNDIRNNDIRNPEVRNDLRNAVRHDAGAPHKSSGFGMPCAKCRLYYPANVDTCPACNSRERVSPKVAPVIVREQHVAEPMPDPAVVDGLRDQAMQVILAPRSKAKPR